MIENPADALENKDRQRKARDAWQKTADSYKSVFIVNGGREEGQPPEIAAAAKLVMADLEKFCHASSRLASYDGNKSIDPYQTMILEGRREVFLRIQHMLGLTALDVQRLAQSA